MPSRQAKNPTARPADPAAPAGLTVLCLHGVGHGDAAKGWQADPGWRAAWRQTILAQLAAAGRPSAQVKLNCFSYDALFGSGPSAAQIARGLELLGEVALIGLLGLFEAGRAVPALANKGFALHPSELPKALRWTAGMAVQWLEDATLRDKLCLSLLKTLRAAPPDIVVAHSLGSLIAYDTLRRAVHGSSGGLADIRGLQFVSLGSQLAHPVLQLGVWGGPLMPLHDAQGDGVSRWFALFNPHDKVFTRRIDLADPQQIALDAPFQDAPGPLDLLALDHDATHYLAHPATFAAMWPLLARGRPGAEVTQALAQSAPGAAAAVQAPSAAPAIPRQGRQRALLVGINAYPDPAMHLDGCVNDVFLVSQLLQESGVSADDIRLLVDQRATQAAICERLEWLTDGAGYGDECLLFYSGHGAQIPCYGPSGEPDHMLETLVPVDFSWDDPATHLTDQEFRRFYAHLPFDDLGGARLTAVFDCCHAAGMTRGAGKVRGINPPADIRHRMLQWNPATGDWDARDFMASQGQGRAFSARQSSRNLAGRQGMGVSANLRPVDGPVAGPLGGPVTTSGPAEQAESDALRRYGQRGPYMPLLVYAAGQVELASEYMHGAHSYGAFTFALVERLRRLRSAGPSFETVVKQVRTVLRSRHYTQHPEVVGPAPVRERPVPWTGKPRGGR